MRSAPKLAPPTLDKFSATVKHNHRVRIFALGVDRVMDVDMTLGVRADAGSVPVLDIGGQFAPIVRYLIGLIARTQNRLLTARFVRRAQDERCCEASADSLKKCSSGNGNGMNV